MIFHSKSLIWVGLIFLILLVIAVLFWKFGSGECKKCNILLITIDHWEYKDASKLNFANQSGVFFDNAVSNSTWALPSYAAMYSGDYPAEQGIWEVGDGLANNQENFVSKLKALGYKTKAYSLGPFFQKQWGFEEGFDEFTEVNDLTDLENLYVSDSKSVKQESKPEFVWLRLGPAGLVNEYETSIDKVLGVVNRILSEEESLDGTTVIVAGSAGKLSSRPENSAISVPLYVFLNNREGVDKESVFELKDIGKLLLEEKEFLENRNDRVSVFALSSVVETEENIRNFYASYLPGKAVDVKVRKEEWDRQHFSSSRSNRWHLIRDLNGEYFLYDLAQDETESNNLFKVWSTLPELERSQAIGVIRSIGGDVPEACGIYCGSYDFLE